MRHSLFAVAAVIGLAALAQTPSGDALYRSFQNPPGDARPFVRWWWNGLYVEEKEILRELDVMKAAGIGGVEINSIAMLAEVPRQSLEGRKPVEWLSPEWNRLVRVAADGARQRGMTADLIVGSGWPFGGRFLAPDDQIQRIALVKRDVEGPTQFRSSITEMAKPRGGRAVFLRLVPAGAADFQPGRDVLSAVRSDGSIEVEVPAGKHTLYAGFEQKGFSNVKLGAPGSDGPVVDHLNARAVRGYLDRLSSALNPAMGGRMGERLRAMFVDSLELDHANWTGDFAVEFEKRRGYALGPHLPFLLDAADGRDTVRRARYDFNVTLVELFRERFVTTYVAWCRANGVKSRIQAYGRETHPLEGSMLVDLPEGESWLWGDADRIVPMPTVANKYVSSGAHLTGKRLVSFESMTNAVPVFRETLEDFKVGLDMSLMTGVNHSILHGFNYTPPEAGFPGWVRFGCYFNEKNSWWPHFRRWADYSARLTSVLHETTAAAEVAILAPRADEWAQAGLLYQPFPEVYVPWYGYHLWEALQQNGVQSDYVSESVLRDSRFEKGQIVYGPRRYEALFVEDVESLEPATATALESYAKAGGKIAFIGRAPSRAPGLKDAPVNDAAVRRHIEAARTAGGSRVGVIEAPKLSGPLPKNVNNLGMPQKERETLLAFAATALQRFSITPAVRLSKTSVSVSHIHHRLDTRDLFFFANTSRTEEASFEATLPTGAKRAWEWDVHTGERRPYPQAGDRVSLRLGPEESTLLVFEPGTAPRTSPPPTIRAIEAVELKTPWQVSFAPVDNQPVFERRFDTLADLSKLAADPPVATFGGVATYRAEFEAPDPRFTALDLGRVANISEVTLNGKPLGVRWYGRHVYDTAGALQGGRNRLEVKVTVMIGNYAKSLAPSNPVAYRWARWFPPIPAGLIGPVRLATRE